MRTGTGVKPRSLDDEWYFFRKSLRYALYCTKQLVKRFWLEFGIKL